MKQPTSIEVLKDLIRTRDPMGDEDVHQTGEWLQWALERAALEAQPVRHFFRVFVNGVEAPLVVATDSEDDMPFRKHAEVGQFKYLGPCRFVNLSGVEPNLVPQELVRIARAESIQEGSESA